MVLDYCRTETDSATAETEKEGRGKEGTSLEAGAGTSAITKMQMDLAIVLGIALISSAVALPVSDPIKLSTAASNVPINATGHCHCHPGIEGCQCLWRTFDQCQTQSWCYWEGDEPEGCACKKGTNDECVCAFRGYDSCLGESWCSWHGATPTGCTCNDYQEDNPNCDCQFRTDQEDCIAQQWCQWTDPPTPEEEMKNLQFQWEFIAANSKVTFTATKSETKTDSHTFTSALSTGFKTSVTAEGGVPFIAEGKASMEVSGSQTEEYSSQFTTTAAQSESTSCQSVCEYGENIFQWKVNADYNGESVWVTQCIFECIPDQVNLVPLCPPTYCDDTTYCQCCNAKWWEGEKEEMNKYLNKYAGGTCEYSLPKAVSD